MISTIITTYNRKALLKKAVKSVLNQSFDNFELIVVDDCSTDGTESYVKGIKDKRVRYIKTKENSGYDSYPKNLGIQEAKGDFVTFLDDDDEYRPDALRVLHTYLTQTNVDVVYGDYLIDGKPGWSVDFSPATLSRMNYISMSVVLVRKNALIDVGGFDEDVKKFKDWNLWLRLQKAGYNFVHVPIIITEVHTQKDSISSKYEHELNEDGSYKPSFNPADCTIFPDNTSLSVERELRVAVYTLTKDRLDMTKEMHDMMRKTAGYEFDWFVVDNGSVDGTVEYIESRAKARVLNKKNEGIAKGWNQAIDLIRKTGDYDIVIKIDNDANLLSDGWLKAMIELFKRNRKIVLSPYVEGLEANPGGVLRQRLNGDSPYMMINDTVLGLVPNIGGIVFASHLSLFDNYKFDESYEGNKDFLLSQYAYSRGYTIFYMEEYRVYHAGQHDQVKDYK